MSENTIFKNIIDIQKFKELGDESGILIFGVPQYLNLFTVELIGKELKSRVDALVFNDIEDFDLYIEDQKSVRSTKYVLKVNGLLDYNQLAKIGYNRVSRVWNPGEFSVYGDVVVIWIWGWQNPIRLSLFDKEIEKISLIDSGDRKSLQDLDNVEIKSRGTGSGELENDFEPEGFERVIGNEGGKSSFKPELYFVRNGIKSYFDEHSNLRVPRVDLNFSSIPYLLNNTSAKSSINHILKDYIRNGFEINVVTARLGKSLNRDLEVEEKKVEVAETLKQLGISPKNIIDQTKLESFFKISKGFASNESKVLFLTDYELYGDLNLSDFEITGTSANGKLSQKSDIIKKDQIFKKIAPGDFVVHEDHGVGLYVGIAERDEQIYLELSYAGKDKLLIPINQARKITKYVGGKHSPELTPLNSGVWRRVTRKAIEDSEKVAKELIQLYAMRQLSQSEVEFESPELLDQFEKFLDTFPYQDTEDQSVATREILEDLQSGKPMDRLLVGDVGFGKTEMAMRAIYGVVKAGFQAALLAPTTVLVEQHKVVLEKRMKGQKLNIASISRFTSSADVKEIIKKLANGKIDIIVGTHALLSEEIKFQKLGIIVIDEEQKFGVAQKEKLKSRRVDCHVLSMSATPIPRTLNMSLSGIRDISVIASPPPNRKPIINKFAKFDDKIVKEAIDLELERGGQVYYLHNRVRNIQSVKVNLERLYPKKVVEIAHGQLTDEELARVMRDFAMGKVDILVCTVIIENGLDLANANTLIVDDANNLGLSQLYQIRGRIGRSDKQAYAYFFYRALKGDAGLRLDAIRDASGLGGGFLLANRDLEIRGAGALLGKAQSGAINSVGYGMYINMIGDKIEELKLEIQKSKKT